MNILVRENLRGRLSGEEISMEASCAVSCSSGERDLMCSMPWEVLCRLGRAFKAAVVIKMIKVAIKTV